MAWPFRAFRVGKAQSNMFDGFEEIPGGAHPHEIPWPLRVKDMSDLCQSFVHLRDGLAYREASERQPVEARIVSRLFLGVGAPQGGVAATLDDPEQGLPLRARRRQCSPSPARRLMDCGKHRGAGGVSRWAHVELHLDISAQKALHANRFLGRKVPARSVQV
jgi:hypothetical protein